MAPRTPSNSCWPVAPAWTAAPDCLELLSQEQRPSDRGLSANAPEFVPQPARPALGEITNMARRDGMKGFLMLSK